MRFCSFQLDCHQPKCDKWRALVKRMDSSSSASHEDATVESSDWNVAESSLDRNCEDTSTCRGRCDGMGKDMATYCRPIPCLQLTWSTRPGHVTHHRGYTARKADIHVLLRRESTKITRSMSMLTSQVSYEVEYGMTDIERLHKHSLK